LEARYADAAALAEDLDRFLRREPLLHAINPSRRERVVNWGFRHRVRLAIAAVCLGFLFAGFHAGRSTTPTRPTFPIEQNEDLKKAIDVLGSNPKESAEILFRLVDDYPESSLPKVYLGFASDELGNASAFWDWFGQAVSRPNAEDELANWSSSDRGLVKRLE